MLNEQVAAAVDLVCGDHLVRFHTGSVVINGSTNFDDAAGLDVRPCGERLTPAISEGEESFDAPNARSRLTALRVSHQGLAALVGASRPMGSNRAHQAGGEPCGGTERQRGRVAGERAAPPQWRGGRFRSRQGRRVRSG